MSKEISRQLLQRSGSICSGIITTFAVPLFLTAEQQGYFYTFLSILAIQIFFELGLSQVLLYRFSAFRGNISAADDSNKLRSLLWVSRKIYVFISLLFCVVVYFSGFFFLSHSSGQELGWEAPWFVLVVATSINLFQSVKMVYLESQGRVADVATFRFILGIISSILFVATLLLRGGLWAVVVMPSINALCTTIWIYTSNKTAIYRDSKSLNGSITLGESAKIWRYEIFPLQWRTSISWVSGYFVFQLVTPLAFQRFGPAVAGQLGFAITAMNSILFLATTFTSALSPKLASLFHASGINEYHHIFDKSFKRSLLAAIVLTQLFVLLVFVLQFSGVGISARLLPWDQLLIYSFTTILSAVVYCWSIYLRSQCIEPLVVQSALTALLMAPALWFSSFISINAMLFSMVIVSLFGSIYAFRIYSLNRFLLVKAVSVN